MCIEITVLKFGSSVLRTAQDLSDVALEINRYAKAKMRVIAVVSAFEGRTNELMATAQARGLAYCSPEYAHHVASGETESAKALVAKLEEMGTGCQCIEPASMELRARGDRQDATPFKVDHQLLQEALRAKPVMIVPGFSAIDEAGRPVLLGRGGSDLTAIFLAKAFGLTKARLIKDVDGVYTQDPNIIVHAKRYQSLSWQEAALVAGSLIQPKAISFAQLHQIDIEIASLGQDRATQIGGYDSKFSPHKS